MSGLPVSNLPSLISHLQALLLIALCAFLVALGGLRREGIDLGVGSERLNSLLFTSGIYAREEHPDGYAYRWTSGAALLQLRSAANAAPAYLAELRLRTEHPEGPQPLIFAANGRPIATVTPDATFRTYRLLLPAGGEELALSLESAPFVAPGNPRPLGVILAGASLRPMAVPDLAGGGVVGLGLLLIYVIWGQISIRDWARTRDGATVRTQTGARARTRQWTRQWTQHATSLLVGLGLAAMSALYRPAPLPYPLLAGLALAGAGAACLVAHRSVARLALAALALIVAFAGVLWPAWVLDDAFISFRYAQNLAQGHGLVYNVGERVEGYTNFFWTLIAAAVLALGGDIVVWTHLSGVVLGLALLLLTYVQARRLLGDAWAVVAALIAGTSQSLLLYTARGAGLETGLFALLLLLAGMAFLDNRLARSGALFALAALTRPEGVLAMGLTVGYMVVRDVWGGRSGRSTLRPYMLLIGVFLVIFAPYFGWRVGYYGDLLPNTFYAKTGGGLRQALRGLDYAGGFALTLGGPLLLLVAAPWLRGRRAALCSWRGYLLLLVVAFSAYIIAVGGDHFRGERFFVPILPWCAILLADGLAHAYDALARRGRRPALLARAGLAALLLLGGVGALTRTAPIDETIRGLDESVWIWREIGWWVANHGSPGASVAASGAGAVAFYSQRTTIDLLGLTDKHIGRLEVADMGAGVAGHEKRDPDYVLNVRRPTYIPQIWEEYFGGPAALRPQYDLMPIRTRTGRELQIWVRRDP